MAISLTNIQQSRMGPPRLVIYGPEGVGKTTLAAQLRKPVFIAAEDGLPNGLAMLRPTNYAEVLECIEVLLNGEHDYQNVVLDSTTVIEPWLHDHVVATVPNEKGVMVKNIIAYGYNKGFDHAEKEWRTNLLAGFNALREHRGMGICLIAHMALERVENPETDPYDKFQIKVQKKAAAALCEWGDAVLFVNQKVTAVKAGENRSGEERKRAVGTGDALIYTTSRPAWQAKNRYRMPREIPLVQDDPAATWAPIQAAIDAMVTCSPTTVFRDGHHEGTLALPGVGAPS